MITQGEQLRRAIKGEGMTYVAAAIAMGMSRESLYYHLNKAELTPEFKRLVKDKLNIDLKPQPGKVLELNTHKGVTTNEDKIVYSPAIENMVLDMAILLRLSMERLLKMQADETDIEKLKLLHEVITTKQLLESLQNENKILREYNELLRDESKKNKEV